jgi:hypothetical protein
MATVLPNSMQTSGPHEVTVRTDGWPAGCYFDRLQVNGRTRTRRMVVLK